MRKILFIAALLFTLAVQAQPNVKLNYSYDTTVLDAGIDTAAHEHDWATKDIRTATTCATASVLACPALWMDQKKICMICFRHLHIKETVTAIIRDEYQEALDKLNVRKASQ